MRSQNLSFLDMARPSSLPHLRSLPSGPAAGLYCGSIHPHPQRLGGATNLRRNRLQRGRKGGILLSMLLHQSHCARTYFLRKLLTRFHGIHGSIFSHFRASTKTGGIHLTGKESVVLADRGYDYPQVHDTLAARGIRNAVARRRYPGQKPDWRHSNATTAPLPGSVPGENTPSGC
jgi:hypothetical protein